MEPLLPKGQGVRLAELTCEILKASGRLTGQVHSPLVLQRVAGLVREMNCYYSNLIEGHKTIPRDIERALKRDFSHDQTQHDNRVQAITGKAATVSVEIIKLGLAEGYFETPSPKGPLRVAFPAKIHEFYFPQLFLDLPVEPPAGRAA